MKSLLKSVTYYKINSIITTLVFLILSAYFAIVTFNFIDKYEDIKRNTFFYDDFSMILVNPNDDIKNEINMDNAMIVYKITYEEIEGYFFRVISTTVEGLKYGLPVYDEELNFIQLNYITNLEIGTLYSNHVAIENFKDEHIIFPNNPFISKKFDPVIIFRIEEFVSDGSLYLIKDDDHLKSYLSEKNRLNYIDNTTFTGEAAFLKNNYLLKYNVFLFIFIFIVFIPVIFIVLLFNVFSRYQIEARFEELLIKQIYFASGFNLFVNFFLEFIILILPSTLIGVMVSALVISVDVKYLILEFMLLLITYSLVFIWNMNKIIRIIKSDFNLEIYRRGIE